MVFFEKVSLHTENSVVRYGYSNKYPMHLPGEVCVGYLLFANYTIHVKIYILNKGW